jgi:DNA-binding IclR family transcriptional regulator
MPMQSVSHTVKRDRRPESPLTRLTHQSLERGLRVLETVAANAGPNSLAETARRTGLHRSTAHHLLQTLVGLGYLRQDSGTRAYELTAKLFQLTGRTWSPEQIGVIAEPILAELTRVTGEASSLATYRDGSITIVAKRESDGPVRVVQDLGAERPVHATAVGKAIVAWLPATELAGVLSRTRFDRFTARTIATRTTFEAELRRIREGGFAIDDEEHHEGIRCIAAPVFAFNGQAMASLCTVGPKSSMTRQKLRDVRAPLRALARTLSERLGWTSESLKNA